MTEQIVDRRRWFGLAVLVAAQFMVVLDIAIVNVALPTIKTDLHFSQESLQWVITAYSILFGGVLLLGGRMADLLGRRRMFMAGLTLFETATLTVLAQQNAVNFTPPKLIEQAQLNLLRGLGKKGEINAFSVPGGPKWIRSPRPDNRVGLPSQ